MHHAPPTINLAEAHRQSEVHLFGLAIRTNPGAPPCCRSKGPRPSGSDPHIVKVKGGLLGPRREKLLPCRHVLIQPRDKNGGGTSNIKMLGSWSSTNGIPVFFAHRFGPSINKVREFPPHPSCCVIQFCSNSMLGIHIYSDATSIETFPVSGSCICPPLFFRKNYALILPKEICSTWLNQNTSEYQMPDGGRACYLFQHDQEMLAFLPTCGVLVAEACFLIVVTQVGELFRDVK